MFLLKHNNITDKDICMELEQYLTFGESGGEERACNWSIAVSLREVDRLKPWEFLLEQTMNINII